MKHTFKITMALILFFFAAQILGLLVINQYIDHKASIEAHETVMKPLPYGFERPQVENQSTSFVPIVIAILIGTLLLLLLVRTKKPLLLKILFFVSVSITLSVAFAAFVNVFVAGILALAISFLRLYKPNAIIQNFSEIFIYGGLAAIVVNIFNLFAVFMLLVAISIYDFIAVFKTKHMVKLATFQSDSKVFAGLLIPYERGKISLNNRMASNHEMKNVNKSKSQRSVAVLGGGDIGFTLIFAGVVMKGLMLKETVLVGFLKTLIIPVFVTFALLILLIKGQRNKFYPAMPVLSIGCFIGYLIVLLV